jgi:hypothetical protein
MVTEYQALPDQDAKDDFWVETRTNRAPIEDSAEDIEECASLILSWLKTDS